MKLLAPALFVFVVSASAASFTLGPHQFTLPEGFTIELAAPLSLAPRPMEADFDEQGRLYVTDSSGSNDKVEKQLADKPHRVLRLEDTNGDGVFDQQVVFADKMMFPEGCLWFDGSLYVAAPPSIWKLTDTDGDGVADKREEWFQGKTLTGCANDLHGPYLGPDGWIYWCKGAFAKQTYTLADGKEFTTRASHIFRARPDGTGIEPVMTGGMDNPVGLAWSPEGELFLSGTFFQNPAGGKRDGLIHVLYGGVYGKDHDVLDGHPRTGPDLLPMMTHLGPAAPCGLARYESSVFGSEYQNNLFVCQFNLHKVSRHVLVPDGSTFKTIDSDFVVSDNTDFHPTDVLEDADGSLLIVDTGGWYKLCCPTSQLAKPDVLGSIYRIRRNGAPKVEDPRGLKLAWSTLKPAQLVGLLEDARPAIRSRAIAQLGRMETNALPTLEPLRFDSKSAEALRNAVWSLCRMTNQQARLATQRFASHRDERIALPAAYAAGVWRDKTAWASVQSAFERGGPQLQRVAAEALSRMGASTEAQQLLTAVAKNPDRALEHALIHAAINLAKPAITTAPRNGTEELRDFINYPSSVQRATLIALDQMEGGGGLKPDQVTPFLASTNAMLKQTASWIVSRHPEWGEALSGFFQQRLAEALTDADREELEGQLARFAKVSSIQALLSGAACSDNGSKVARRSALRAMARSGLKDMPATWSHELGHSLQATDVELVRETIAALRALPTPKTDVAEITAGLSRAAADPLLGPVPRLDALAALPGGFKQVEPAAFNFLLAQLQPEKSVLLRGTAAGILSKAQLNSGQLTTLADALPRSGPLEVTRLLSAFSRSSDETLGFKVVSALKESKALSSLRAETVKPALTNFPASVRQKADELLASLNTDAAQQKAHLEELLGQLKDGDIRRGQTIFNSSKAACASCHAIGYLGGNLGPDLTRIGEIRTDRDLLESIIYPSASLVRSFEPMLVATKSGDEHSGVLRKDSPDEIVLATGPGVEARIARSEILEMRPGAVSVMPQGLDAQLSKPELADLLAFLKATRWGAR